jgi:hypothetical protein
MLTLELDGCRAGAKPGSILELLYVIYLQQDMSSLLRRQRRSSSKNPVVLKHGVVDFNQGPC